MNLAAIIAAALAALAIAASTAPPAFERAYSGTVSDFQRLVEAIWKYAPR